jgi:hypothetical protein
MVKEGWLKLLVDGGEEMNDARGGEKKKCSATE